MHAISIATNSFEHTLKQSRFNVAMLLDLQVILSCVYGPTSTARLKQQGMEFAVWVFKDTDDAQLQPHANSILQNLLQLLNQGERSLKLGYSIKSQT